ncbi:autoinhibited calcium ATPase, partial [Corchorus olitorius]
MSSIFKGSPYRRPNDVEAGSSRSAHSDNDYDEFSDGPFNITSTKNAPIDSLRRWR